MVAEIPSVRDDVVALTLDRVVAETIARLLQEAVERCAGATIAPPEDGRSHACLAFAAALAAAVPAQRCPLCGAVTPRLRKGVCLRCAAALDTVVLEHEDAERNARAGISTVLHGRIVRPGTFDDPAAAPAEGDDNGRPF